MKGSVSQARIVAGYDVYQDSANPDAGIGAVSIGGDLLASSIAAGVENSGGFTHFGDGSDTKIPEATPDAILSKIASITVGGFAAGTPDVAGDHFGFVAEVVGKVRVGTATFLLNSSDRLTGLPLGPTGDLTLREV